MVQLPFTHEQFIQVFAEYNAAVWPAQFAAYVLGLAVVVAAFKAVTWAPRFVPVALAAMWLWIGMVYHWLHFATINQAAVAFGAVSVVQAVLFAIVAARGGLDVGRGRGAAGVLGWLLIAYALVVYPLLGMALGQTYPGMPMFGITPCPVTIFTFGVLLLARQRVPWWLLVIPGLWTLIGGSAAMLLQVPQDWMLLFSILAIIPIAFANRDHRTYISRPG